MLEVNLISSDGVKIMLDNERRQTSCEIDPKAGEHRLEIFTDAENIRQVKVFDQTLDRKKALRLENSVLFVFDIVNKHANFSKHTGSFGTTMLRKDRIMIDD